MSASRLPSRGARFWLVSVAATVGVVLTAGLGRWQIERATFKESLQSEMAARAALAPMDAAQLHAALASTGAADEAAPQWYRKVQLTGHWLPERTVYLDNRQMGERAGFFVVTPLQIDGEQDVVLVQRGWAPRNYREREALPPLQTPEGRVVVRGHLAAALPQTFSLGSDRVGQGFLRIRQNLGIDAFRAETGLALVGAVVVQEGDASEGLLRQWPPPATGVQKNYGYAFQWFALCGLILGLYVWFQFVKPRQRQS